MSNSSFYNLQSTFYSLSFSCSLISLQIIIIFFFSFIQVYMISIYIILMKSLKPLKILITPKIIRIYKLSKKNILIRMIRRFLCHVFGLQFWYGKRMIFSTSIAAGTRYTFFVVEKRTINISTVIVKKLFSFSVNINLTFINLI